MDISASDWAPGKSYKKHDIVRLRDLSTPYYIEKVEDKKVDLLLTLVDDCGNKIITDQSRKVELDVTEFSQFFERVTVRETAEIEYGIKFKLNPTIGYSAKVMIRKISEDSTLNDPNLTYFQIEDYGLDKSKSTGVGVGLKFYDEKMDLIEDVKHRKIQRAMASSELHHREWYKTQIDIHPNDIPQNAAYGSAFIFLYGYDTGGFEFRDVEVYNLSQFFYCTEDHVSAVTNEPNYLRYWTQDFKWRPSYGSQATFAAINESMVLGEGGDYVNNLAINSLPLEIDLSFNNRTDQEAKAIIHFLQEKHFPYGSIFGLDYKGERLLSSDVQDFSFTYTFPYRKDLKYTCTDFSHSITYRNNNAIQAKFICNTESTLRSVESNAGYNRNTDAIFPVFVNEETFFEKGKIARLDSFPVEEFIGEDAQEKSEESQDDDDEKTVALTSLSEIEAYAYDENGYPKAGILYFREEQKLEVGNCLYIRPEWPENSTYSVGVCKVFKVINPRTFVFGVGQGYIEKITYTKEICPGLEWPLDEPIKEIILDSRLQPNGDPHNVGPYDPITNDEDNPLEDDETLEKISRLSEERDAPVVIYKLGMCPEDCLAAQPILPPSIEDGIIPHKIKNPVTGEEQKRIIYLKNYRMLQMEADITPSSFALYVTPLSSFSLKPEDDGQILIPAVTGRSSIYMENPELTAKYPWLQVRNFEHRPSIAFNINNQPKHYNTEFTKFYNKKYKKGINQNMSTFTVVFDKRDDTEAAEILQFLESHLGYKKFRFVMPRPYGTDADPLTTQSRPHNSTFYCPSWNHEIVYKNNHTISATFIESSTAVQEDLANPKGPCFGAYIYNPITQHEMCTFSSVGVAKHQSGLDYDSQNQSYSIEAKNKEIDIIFVIDSSPSTRQQFLSISDLDKSKYALIIDSILKSIVGYDKSKFPLTESFNGAIDVSGDPDFDGSPPWPNFYDENGQLIYDKDPESEQDFYQALVESGYDTDNFFRFNLKLEEKNINVGFSFMGTLAINEYPGTEKRILDLNDYPTCFDKKTVYEKISNIDAEFHGAKNSLEAIADAMAQLYNSKRAESVDQRMIFLISDFNFSGANESGLKQINDNIRSGKELSQRRPKDSILSKYANGLIAQKLKEFSYAPSWKGFNADKQYSYLFNPDYSEGGNFEDEEKSNPAWYLNEVDTLIFPVSLGLSGEGNTDSSFYEYAKDYSLEKRRKELEMNYKISNTSPGSREALRCINFSKVLSNVTQDSGFQNLFSVTIKNCGPNDIKLRNIIANTKSSSGFLGWTTEKLSAGVPKNNNFEKIETMDGTHQIDWTIPGNGGQYFNDPNNKKMFEDENSNTLWHSFNTKYEVYRDGKLHEINGGWRPDKETFLIATDAGDIIGTESNELIQTDLITTGEIKTKGSQNAGVVSNGFPLKVFGKNKELEILDYNVSDLNEANDFTGNYDHLPILKMEECIDLFFGLRIGNVSELQESVELLFYTEDLEDKTMSCYARFEFLAKFKMAEDSILEIPENAPPVIGPGCRACFSGGLQIEPNASAPFAVIPPFQTHAGALHLADIIGGDNFDSVESTLAQITPNATSTTFDSIFVDTTTRVKVWSGTASNPGYIAFDCIGPFMLSNSIWINDPRYSPFFPNWDRAAGDYKDEDGNSIDNFWKKYGIRNKDHFNRINLYSESNMHNWPYGRVKIECLRNTLARDENGILINMPDDYCYKLEGGVWIPTECRDENGDLKDGSEDLSEVMQDPENLVRYGITNR